MAVWQGVTVGGSRAWARADTGRRAK